MRMRSRLTGLPVVVHGGRGLLERPEVLDAISLLSAVADPTEDASLAAVLRSPYGRLCPCRGVCDAAWSAESLGG